MTTQNWRTLENKKIDEDIQDRIRFDIEKNIEEFDLNVYIGCDSQVHRKNTRYVTSIAIHRHDKDTNQGRAGFGYKCTEYEKTTEMKQKLVMETHKAIVTATWLSELLIEYNMGITEIHADLNADPKHPSNDCVRQAMGYITGMGFVGRIKPHAWAASVVSDKWVR